MKNLPANVSGLARVAWACASIVLLSGWLALSIPTHAKATEPTTVPLNSPLIHGLANALRGEMILTTPGIVFGETPETHKTTKPLVVLVPGLLAREGSMDSLRSALDQHCYSTALLHYSSHEGITSAATLLAKELRNIRETDPKRQVVLLTHSMGGLVARACLENESTNPGNVTQLIMIAPPNHGSAVAGLSAAELAKTFAWPEEIAATGLQTVDDAVGGFFGVAKQELRPDSEILLALNSRKIPAGVRYCVIAGTGGPIQGELIEMSLLVGGFLFGGEPETKASLERISQLAKLDEWTQGRGDGVVSLKSAQLNGVTDFVSLPFSHNEFGEESSDAATQVIREIIQRLGPSEK